LVIWSNYTVFFGGGRFFTDVATIQMSHLVVSEHSCGSRGGGLHDFAKMVAMTLAIDGAPVSATECREGAGIDLRGDNIELRLRNIASVHDRPDNDECAAVGDPRPISWGSNILARADSCELSAAPEDRFGAAANPVRLNSGEPAAGLKR